MRVFLGAAVLIFVATAYTNAAGEPKPDEKTPDIAGSYRCAGKNPGGGAYEGTVEIKKKGDTWLIEWSVGSTKYNGVGIVNGAVLSTSWATIIDGKLAKGVAVYRIEKDKLVGRWAMFPGDGKVYEESLTRVY